MATKIRCHYEVLGVERSANNDDLKKAYRKLALKFHPDKNPDDVDGATAQFRVVQQAYEILTDAQERAWYDRHREAILRGGQGKGDKYEDNSLDVFQYFTTSCYSGYGDDDKGFYTVYREIFKKLAAEDYEFMDDKDSDHEFPEFGTPESDYEEVVKPFYDFWHAFCTAKSYVWEEEYDTREAPDRRTRRMMEAENKKKRDAAKKERNEEIRALVAFVRKRDKRVQEHKKRLEQRAAEIEKKTKEKREKELQDRLKQYENYKETGWSAMSGLEGNLQQLEAQLANQFGDHSDSSGEEEEEEGKREGADNGTGEAAEELDVEDFFDSLFCPACNKSFKSEKAMHNHEKSKKHKDMVAILRAELEEDEEELDLQEDEGEESDTDVVPPSDTQNDTATTPSKPSDANLQGESSLQDLEVEEEEEEEYVSRAKSKKQKKKRRQKAQEDDEGEESDTDIVPSSDTQNDTATTPSKPADANLQDESSLRDLKGEEEEEEEEEYVSRAKSKKQKKERKQKAQEPKDIDDLNNKMNKLLAGDPNDDGKRNSKSQKNKKKDKKASNVPDIPEQNSSEPAEPAEAESSIPGPGEDLVAENLAAENGTEETTDLAQEDTSQIKGESTQGAVRNARPVKVKDSQKCMVCQQAFPSRSKLFEHIKTTGHAVPLTVKQAKEEAAAAANSQEIGKKKNKKKGKLQRE
ncbi:dnaJ homolog subfamily C member 21-like isoform X2 [Littorina saxatilis]|uniref:dnaJ homolog subfamily C member 21-like isoform X2 n=1 Tax=Littorina saxatilis TaxID=31220 RepID=UPI0038B5679F